MDLCLPRRFVRKWTNRTHPKFELDSPNSFSVTLLTQFMILLSHSDIYCNHIATHLSRIEKICLIWNKFLFLPIKFILQKIAVSFFARACCRLPGKSSMTFVYNSAGFEVEMFSTKSSIWFSLEKAFFI